MESFVSLLRLALDRAWSVGLVLVIFCESALWADARGWPLPSAVIEWSRAGLLFGIAILAAAIVTWLWRSIGSGFSRLASRRQLKEAQARDAFANLGALREDELGIFLHLLSSGQQRFEVHLLSPAYPLLQKRVLEEVHGLSAASWICQIQPAIAANKDAVIAHFRQYIER